MITRVGIVGAGILGRLTAWVLAKAGLDVTVFDRGQPVETARCSAVAAGMLAPLCESPDAPAVVKDLGQESLVWWRAWADEIGMPHLVTQRGTIVVAPERSPEELSQFRQDLVARGAATAITDLHGPSLQGLEPDFDERFQEALFLADEGHLAPAAVLAALHETSLSRRVTWQFETDVTHLDARRVRTERGTWEFDWVVDARGWAAKSTVHDLMPVRGEILTLATQDLRLTRPVRVLHPRHAIYIVPRGDGRLVIGATNIPSDDASPISVLSTLEFLSVAYHVFPALAEARIVGTATGIRPAFADHRPLICEEGRLLRMNGAYRHGYLVGPALAQRVAERILGGAFSEKAQAIVRQGGHDASHH